MASDEHISLRIGRETTVTLMFEGPLSQEEIQKLRNILDIMADTYPPTNEPPAEERTGGPIQWNKANAS